MRLRAATGWAVTVLLASVGCGQTSGTNDTGSGAGSGGGNEEPSVMGLDFAQSGSRVVALGYSSNEARLFRTFHDTRWGFDCSFVPDAAGRSQRCAPSKGLPLIYTDAGCTEPAAWVERWGEEDIAAVGDAVSGVTHQATSRASCPGDAPAHLGAYRVAERLSEPVFGGRAPLDVYEMREGACVETNFGAKIAPAVHRLTPIPESDLARGERVSLRVSDGMRLIRLIADDGAELSVGVASAEGSACSLQRDGECVPEPIAVLQPMFNGGHVSTALDGDCSVPAFVTQYPDSCGSPTFGLEDDGGRLKVRALERVSGFFRWDLVLPVGDALEYACTPYENDESSLVSAAGRDLTGTLPTAEKLRRGSGPLHLDWFSVGQNELAPVLAQFANDAGQVCTIQTAEDGTLHCAILSEQTGLPIAELTTFPEIVSFTY